MTNNSEQENFADLQALSYQQLCEMVQELERKAIERVGTHIERIDHTMREKAIQLAGVGLYTNFRLVKILQYSMFTSVFGLYKTRARASISKKRINHSDHTHFHTCKTHDNNDDSSEIHGPPRCTINTCDFRIDTDLYIVSTYEK